MRHVVDLKSDSKITLLYCFACQALVCAKLTWHAQMVACRKIGYKSRPCSTFVSNEEHCHLVSFREDIRHWGISCVNSYTQGSKGIYFRSTTIDFCLESQCSLVNISTLEEEFVSMKRSSSILHCASLARAGLKDRIPALQFKGEEDNNYYVLFLTGRRGVQSSRSHFCIQDIGWLNLSLSPRC